MSRKHPTFINIEKFGDKRLQNAFYFALRYTLVTSNIETGTKVGYGQTSYRVVTLDGVIVEIIGAMVCGGKPRRGTMGNVTMKYNNEIDEKEMNRLNDEYINIIKEYNQMKNEYNSCEQE